jgi:hypothetical protein
MIHVEFLRFDEHRDPAIHVQAQRVSDLLAGVRQVGID